MRIQKNKYDLICIGAGSAGVATANLANQFGAKCAIIESDKLGGTCVNRGCVPKKIMWYASQLAGCFHDAEGYGFQIKQSHFNWQTLIKQREQYISRINESYAKKLSHKKIDIYKGSAEFVDSHTIQVNDTILCAKHIVIACGSHPVIPDIPGKEFVITSDDFFKLQHQPKKVAVIGAGYIGVELASLLHSFGSEVHLFMRGKYPLSHFDNTIQEKLSEIFVKQGIKIYPTHLVTEIRKQNKFSVICENKTEVTGFDTVIAAIGRNARTQKLHLDKIGIALDHQGFIQTDKYQNTNIPRIYAVGDITGLFPLTPVAISAGRALARRLFNNEKNSYLEYKNIPTVVFAHPPIGTIGLTEQEARKKFADEIKIYQSHFTPMYYALTPNPIPTTMKLITLGQKEKIIGCHLIGLNADEILQGFAVAIQMGATKTDFTKTIAIHPTSAEEFILMK